MIKVGSDFSGVGAFNQALNRLGISYSKEFACDMDKYARQTYLLNYDAPKYFPVNVYDRDIPVESLDIYMTSPPCQAFSLAGKRLGKNDERGILFFNSLEFIRINKPRYFIFENVKGLLSDDEGRTFSEWVNLLGGRSVNGLPVIFPYEDSVPYHLYYSVLNSKNYGVPQNRERIFLVGIRDDQDNFFSFPKEEPLTKTLKDILEREVYQKYYLSDKMIDGFNKHNVIHKEKGTGFIFQPKNENDIANCLRANAALCPTDNVLKIGIWRTYKDDKGFKEAQDNNCPTISARARQDGSRQPVVDFGNRIRRLTPRECFRLMDFPDSFVWNVSDSQAYKQAGNSIVVNVLAKIISKLKL